MESVPVSLQQRIEKLRQFYQENHWPEEWLCDILREIHIWSCYSLRRGGPYAVPAKFEGWLDTVFSGRLIRIGRLEYDRESRFGGRIVVFRRGEEVLAMAEDGLVFGESGFRADSGWKSVLRQEGGTWTGNRITAGRAERVLTAIPADEWEIVLRYEDPMTGIHIPEDGELNPEACRKSLQKAAAFFAGNDPAWRGFFCQSWLLHPAYREILDDSSNIVQFQKLGMLYPMGAKVDPLDRLYPGKLRDFVLKQQAAGRELRDGGMFILRSAGRERR